VLHPLREKDLFEILDTITLPKFATLLREKCAIELYATESAKKLIIRESRDEINQTLGARALAAVFDRKVKEAIGNLLELGENGGLSRKDTIVIDTEITDESGEKKEKISIQKVIRSS